MYDAGDLSAQVRHSCCCWNKWRKGPLTVINISLFIVLTPTLLGACMAAIEQGEVRD